MSSGALRSKKGGGDWIQEPTWAINLCLHNSRPCSYCLSVPAHDVKEQRSEVIFVPLCFLLILRLLEPAHGGSFGCHSILLKLWERAVLPSGHSPLFLHPSTCVFAHSRPLRQQSVQRWCTKPMGGPHVSMTCLLHDTVVVKWGLRAGRNLSQTTLLDLPGYCCRDSWALRLVSALGSRQPVPVLLQHIAMELPR